MWDVFGGHAEPGETPSDTFTRELQEELTIVPTQYHLTEVFNYFEGSVQKKIQYHHFIITEWLGEVRNCGTEHTEIRWFSRPEPDALPLAAKEYLALFDT